MTRALFKLEAGPSVDRTLPLVAHFSLSSAVLMPYKVSLTLTMENPIGE
jgi:hypothetical protein